MFSSVHERRFQFVENLLHNTATETLLPTRIFLRILHEIFARCPGGSGNSHEIDSIYLRSIPKSNTSTYVLRVPNCSNPNPEKEGWKQPKFEEEGINHIYKCQR
jgi:hypothetical protein